MLDEDIISLIIEREIGKEKKERRDSGWQPSPLYQELEIPQPLPLEREPVEINIWGPQNDDTVVDNNVVTVLDGYSSKKYF